MTKIGL
jgi:hypothetical protein